MRILLRWLRDTDQSPGSYVWRAGILGVIPIVAVELMEPQLALAIAQSLFQSRILPMPWSLGVIVLAPWLEIFLMWPVLWILRQVIDEKLWVACIFAVIWSASHGLVMLQGLQSVGCGILVVWPFFIISLCFLEWEKKSNGKAIVVAALVFTCQCAAVGLATILILMVFATYGPYVPFG